MASLVGFSSVYNYLSQQKQGVAYVVGLATIGIVALTIIQNAVGLAVARKKDSTHELEGCLYTLHAVLAPPDGCRLRLAIHVPVGETLEQVTEYIGDTPKSGRVGRQYPANAGIIGKAYREQAVFVGRRVNDDCEAYVRELVVDWNYTEDRARLLNPGVKEWMAVPFYDSERRRVDAVLYIDVTHREFFTPERQETVLAAVRGIAIFVGRRYS